MRELQAELGAAGEVSIETVLRAPGVVRVPNLAETLLADIGKDTVDVSCAAKLAEALRAKLAAEAVAGVNVVTGDFSRGAGGFWIEKGELTHPEAEVTVAGNLNDMLPNLTPASDLELLHGIDAPTVRIDGMTLAGK